MSDSIRQKIADNRIETARRMTQGSGYNFDWKEFHDGPTLFEPDEVPAWGYNDPTDQLEEIVYPLHSRTLTVEIHGTHYCEDADEQNRIGRMLIADLERNAKADITCGDLAVDVRILRCDIFPSFPADDRVTVVMAAEIDYRTHAEDPNRSQ